jgi:leucyl/phenylalanyl-tRNA--protein transferase
MQDAYLRLHELGLAHSVEVREHGHLVGGLYGVLLGNMFFGESMFSLQTNASKVAFIALSRACHNSDIELIDCQVENPHLLSLGADLISREDFENHVRDAIKVDMRLLLSKPLCMVPTPPLPLAMRLASDLPMSAGDLL